MSLKLKVSRNIFLIYNLNDHLKILTRLNNGKCLMVFRFVRYK